MKDSVLKQSHSGAFSENCLARGLYERLTRRFWWDGIYSAVTIIVEHLLLAAYRGSGHQNRPHYFL